MVFGWLVSYPLGAGRATPPVSGGEFAKHGSAGRLAPPYRLVGRWYLVGWLREAQILACNGLAADGGAPISECAGGMAISRPSRDWGYADADGKRRARQSGRAPFSCGSAEAQRTFLYPYTAFAPSSSSMRSSWLYFAMRSVRLIDPVLICPEFVATAMSAIVASSVSPERCEVTDV